MTTTLSCETDCRITGLVLVCYRDGRKVFRPYVPAHDANNYAHDAAPAPAELAPQPAPAAN